MDEIEEQIRRLAADPRIETNDKIGQMFTMLLTGLRAERDYADGKVPVDYQQYAAKDPRIRKYARTYKPMLVKFENAGKIEFELEDGWNKIVMYLDGLGQYRLCAKDGDVLVGMKLVAENPTADYGDGASIYRGSWPIP